MAKEEVDITKACELIAEWFLKAPQSSQEPLPEVKKQEPISDSGTQSKTVDTLIKEEPNPPLSFSLKNLNQDHSYLKERGLTEETIRTFGLGYCNRGIMKGRVVIPIHNEKGRFVAYAGRWPGEAPETESKYKLPLGFKKHLEVFNLNRVEDNASELIVVEGFFYCMKLWQAGYRNTVAVMGADISPKQGELIISALGKDGRVITMFDGDEAGYRGVFKALSMFLHRIFIKEIRLEKGQQPDTLTEEEIKNLLS
jgi:DNA primase